MSKVRRCISGISLSVLNFFEQFLAAQDTERNHSTFSLGLDCWSDTASG